MSVSINQGTDSTALVAESPRRAGWRTLLSRTAFWIAVTDILLILIFGLLSRNQVFLSGANFQNLALDGTQVILLAVGAALLLAAGEFDISLGANVILSSVTSGIVVSNLQTDSFLILILVGGLVAIATGATVGLINGVIVTRLKVNSLIATLAMLGIVTGTANILTGGADLAGIPTSLQSDFGTHYLFGMFPLPAVIAIVVTAIFWIVMTKTRFGLHTLASGSSRASAERAGIKTAAHITALYAIVGGLAGLAGLIDISRFATTNIAGHQVDSLAAIAGAVIGGTSLFGGRISVLGALIGAMLAVILQAGLVVLGLPSFYQLIAIGIVLIAAVYLDESRASRKFRLVRKKQPQRLKTQRFKEKE
ncbi:MAG: ABC transporter permease [Terrimesophilobacter sp.]